MDTFINIGEYTLRRDTIKLVKVSYDAQQTDDYAYAFNSYWRPTDIYLDIITNDNTYKVTVLDDYYSDFVWFISKLYGYDGYELDKATDILYRGINLALNN